MEINYIQSPKGWRHDGNGDCNICGVAFAHIHPDKTKPKELFTDSMIECEINVEPSMMYMDTPIEEEISPDGKASVAMMEKDTCYTCGQVIDEKIYWEHAIKSLEKQGLPSLAHALKMIKK